MQAIIEAPPAGIVAPKMDQCERIKTEISALR